MAETSDGNIFSLNEFTECFNLPKWVEVVGGGDVSPARTDPSNIHKGMIVLFRTLAVENVMLSFNDSDTGVKRIVRVSPDTLVKFKVLLPWPDFKQPSGPRTVYQTVNDLLTVCPTYFKANVFYDDPYLPAIVKSGEVFRFIRRIKHPEDRRVYLQCEDPTGNIVDLPAECRGDFTAIEDEKSYTLKELLELGPVDRKLKLSQDHMQMSLITESGGEDALYSNLSEGSSVLQRIMGLPLTYDGLISFHSPNLFLAVSPSDHLQDIWKVPLSKDVHVKKFEAREYEQPTTDCELVSCPPTPFKLYKLSELVDTYHEDFPVLATLVHYKDMPAEFIHCLTPGCDVVIHSIERFDRILAKSGEMHYSIAKDMNGRFRKTRRKFSSIMDIKSQCTCDLSGELTLKVCQDVASDFPIPFSLQSGDILRIKTLETKMYKVKLKSFSPCPVITCKKRKESGVYEKIKLPEDLEISLHEMPSNSKADGFLIEDVFRFRPEFPFTVDYIADNNYVWTCLPVTSEIVFTNMITEPLVVISPVANSEGSPHIDNRVRDCLLVPARHHMMLTVKQCLGFPPGYFMFPDKRIFLSVPVEKICKKSYDELIRHNDMAYEDYFDHIPKTTTCDTLLPTRVKTTNTSKESDSLNKRFSRSLNKVFKNKGRPSFFNKLNISNGDKLVSGVDNETYNPGSIQSDDTYDDDENMYEHVDISGNRN